MQIIAKLAELISEELEDAERYADLACKTRAAHPKLANTFIDLAEQELGHSRMLHAEAARLIEEVKERDGEPPAGMLAVYEYEHGKLIKHAATIRQQIAEYKDT